MAPSGTLTATKWQQSLVQSPFDPRDWVDRTGSRAYFKYFETNEHALSPHQVALSGIEWHQVAHSLSPSGSKVRSRARSIRGIGWIERALDHISTILRRMNMPYLRFTCQHRQILKNILSMRCHWILLGGHITRMRVNIMCKI